MTLFDLSGQVAVVTGASRGIGRAIALRLAEHGAKVLVSSRKLDACELVVDEIRRAGGEAFARACHIGSREATEALIAEAVHAWGRVDTLVCNAAINPHYGSSHDLDDAMFDKIMHYNVRSNLWLSRLVHPHMKRQGGGSIVLISSIGGFQGNDLLGGYAISKAAEMQMARNLAVEWGADGIRVNAIAPGLIKTDFAEEIWSNPARRARAEAITPLGRMGTPDEIAGAAVFLAAPAGRYVTGHSLLIDGGRLVNGRVAIG